MKIVVAQAIGSHRVDVRRLDQPAIATDLRIAHVIEQDDEDVGRSRFWFRGFGIPLHGFLVGSSDLAFENLSILLEGRVVRVLVLRQCRRDAEKRCAN